MTTEGSTVWVGCFHDLALCDGAAECLNCGRRWIDPAVVREQITREIGGHNELRNTVTAGGNQVCSCGWMGSPGREYDAHLADAIADVLGVEA